MFNPSKPEWESDQSWSPFYSLGRFPLRLCSRPPACPLPQRWGWARSLMSAHSEKRSPLPVFHPLGEEVPTHCVPPTRRRGPLSFGVCSRQVFGGWCIRTGARISFLIDAKEKELVLSFSIFLKKLPSPFFLSSRETYLPKIQFPASKLFSSLPFQLMGQISVIKAIENQDEFGSTGKGKCHKYKHSHCTETPRSAEVKMNALPTAR